MRPRPPSGPLKRTAARGAGRVLVAVSRWRRWPGLGGADLPGARVRRVAVPAPSHPRACVLVVTPTHGDPATMPVLYLLHGWPDAPEAPLAAGLARAVGGRAAVRGAAGSGGAVPGADPTGGGPAWPPFVLAVPVGVGWRRGDHEWADAADGASGDLVESWLVDAVVPAVEGEHPRPASRRTLAGFSMGGYGAVNVGLRRPGVFGSLAAFSGYFRADDPEDVLDGDPSLMRANSPLLRAAHPGTRPPQGLRVALVETDHEPALVAGQAAVAAATLRGAGVEVLELHSRGWHAWRSVAASWPDVLAWLATGWGGPDR